MRHHQAQRRAGPGRARCLVRRAPVRRAAVALASLGVLGLAAAYVAGPSGAALVLSRSVGSTDPTSIVFYGKVDTSSGLPVAGAIVTVTSAGEEQRPPTRHPTPPPTRRPTFPPGQHGVEPPGRQHGVEPPDRQHGGGRLRAVRLTTVRSSSHRGYGSQPSGAPRFFARAFTAEDGTWRIDPPSGEYRLTITDRLDGRELAATITFATSPGHAYDLTATVEPVGSVLFLPISSY